MELKKITLTTPEHVSLNFNLAGLGSRAAAHMLDWLFLGLIYTGLMLSFIFFMARMDVFTYFNQYIGGYFTAFLVVISFILGWGYFALFEFFTSGRTPGKKLMGIRVIQDNGQSLTFLSALVRNLFRIIDFLPSFYLLGIILIFFQAKYQRIGDIAAGTIVVYQQTQRQKKAPALPGRKNGSNPQPNKQLLDEWSLKKFGPREWELLQTFMLRRSSLDANERTELTRKVAGILLPRAGIETGGRELAELETDLSDLYLQLQKEWEFGAGVSKT